MGANLISSDKGFGKFVIPSSVFPAQDLHKSLYQVAFSMHGCGAISEEMLT
jgi:hypothetical protein